MYQFNIKTWFIYFLLMRYLYELSSLQGLTIPKDLCLYNIQSC